MKLDPLKNPQPAQTLFIKIENYSRGHIWFVFSHLGALILWGSLPPGISYYVSEQFDWDQESPWQTYHKRFQKIIWKFVSLSLAN